MPNPFLSCLYLFVLKPCVDYNLCLIEEITRPLYQDLLINSWLKHHMIGRMI